MTRSATEQAPTTSIRRSAKTWSPIPKRVSVPEELLLLSDGSYETIVHSNQVASDQLIMSDAQIVQLRGHLATIHSSFKTLYAPAADERFAMEIEFKITSDNVLAIKQARPWVFRPLNEPPAFPDTESGVRSIPELAQWNTDIGAPVAATDAEGDTLTYTLSGTDAGLFGIVPETGALLTAATLDYETRSTYSVTAGVHDGRDRDGLERTTIDDSINVSIVVTNEEEAGTLTLSSEQPQVGYVAHDHADRPRRRHARPVLAVGAVGERQLLGHDQRRHGRTLYGG